MAVQASRVGPASHRPNPVAWNPPSPQPTQCAAAGLLTAASGSGGRELVDRRCSARDLLLGGRGATVSDWQGSGSVLLPPATIKREIAVGSASGDWGGPSERRWFEKLPLTEWAHADTERVPGSERWVGMVGS